MKDLTFSIYGINTTVQYFVSLKGEFLRNRDDRKNTKVGA